MPPAPRVIKINLGTGTVSPILRQILGLLKGTGNRNVNLNIGGTGGGGGGNQPGGGGNPPGGRPPAGQPPFYSHTYTGPAGGVYSTAHIAKYARLNQTIRNAEIDGLEDRANAAFDYNKKLLGIDTKNNKAEISGLEKRANDSFIYSKRIRSIDAKNNDAEEKRVIDQFEYNKKLHNIDMVSNLVEKRAADARARRLTKGIDRQTAIDIKNSARVDKQIGEITESFGKSYSAGEAGAMLLSGPAARNRVREGRIQQLVAANPNLKGLEAELRAPTTGKGKFFRPGNLKDFGVQSQIGYAAIFGGLPGAAVATLASLTPLGKSGAFLASTVLPGVEAIIRPLIDGIKSHEEEFKQAGQAYGRSILGITAVLQQTTQVVNAQGIPLGTSNPAAQLAYQTKQAEAIQLAARSKLLPLGIGGQTEATFVQGTITALANRGFDVSGQNAGRIANITQNLGALIRTQRPQLLESPNILLRDLNSVLGGSTRPSILASIVGKETTGELKKARSTADVEKILSKFDSYAETVKGSTNITAVLGRQQGATDLLNTLGGNAYYEALKPGIQKFTDLLQTDDTKKAVESLGSALGNISAIFLKLSSDGVDLVFKLTNALAPMSGFISLLAAMTPSLGLAGIAIRSSGFLGPVVGTTAALGIAALGVGETYYNNLADQRDKRTSDQEGIVDQYQAGGAKARKDAGIKAILEKAGITEDALNALVTKDESSPLNKLSALSAALGSNSDSLSQYSPFLKKEQSDLSNEYFKTQASQIFGNSPFGEIASNSFLSSNLSVGTDVNKSLSKLYGQSDNAPATLKEKQKALGLATNALDFATNAYQDNLSRQKNKSKSNPLLSLDYWLPGDTELDRINKDTDASYDAFHAAKGSFNYAKGGVDELSKPNTFFNDFIKSENEILGLEKNKVEYAQKSASLASQIADSFKGAFVTSTQSGALGSSQFQQKYLTVSLNKFLESGDALDARIARANSQLTKNENALGEFNYSETDRKNAGGFSTKHKLAGALSSPLSDEEKKKLLEQSDTIRQGLNSDIAAKEGNKLDIARSIIALSNAQLEGRNTNLLPYQNYAQLLNPETNAGAAAIGKNNLNEILQRRANIDAQIRANYGDYKNAQNDNERSVFSAQGFALNNQFGATFPAYARQGQLNAQQGFAAAGTGFDLKIAQYQNANLLKDEALQRTAVTDALKDSKTALDQFNASLEENQYSAVLKTTLAARGLKDKYGIDPGIDTSDSYISQLKKNSDIANYNTAAYNTGSPSLGGTGANFYLPGNAPVNQGLQSQQDTLIGAVSKSNDAFNTLSDTVGKTELALKSLLSSLGYKTGDNTDTVAVGSLAQGSPLRQGDNSPSIYTSAPVDTSSLPQDIYNNTIGAGKNAAFNQLVNQSGLSTAVFSDAQIQKLINGMDTALTNAMNNVSNNRVIHE